MEPLDKAVCTSANKISSKPKDIWGSLVCAERTLRGIEETIRSEHGFNTMLLRLINLISRDYGLQIEARA